jgi:hypothetical protein
MRGAVAPPFGARSTRPRWSAILVRRSSMCPDELVPFQFDRAMTTTAPVAVVGRPCLARPESAARTGTLVSRTAFSDSVVRSSVRGRATAAAPNKAFGRVKHR